MFACITHVQYIPFARDPNAHDFAWWQSRHPDMVLYQCDKRTPAYNFGENDTMIPLDISSQDVVDWQLVSPTLFINMNSSRERFASQALGHSTALIIGIGSRI